MARGSLLGLVLCGLGFLAVADAGSNSSTTDQQDLFDEIDCHWVLSCGFLVIFMQAGFALVEAGTISTNHIQNILFKNFLDLTFGALMFFLIGYGFAFGKSVDGFMGLSNFGMHGFENRDYHLWFFHYAFSSVASTIVSGALAGRCKVEGYFVYTIFMAGLVYPIVVHWVWAEDGWLFKWGMIDYAGGAVVHMTGGWMALMGAYLIGPRLDRFVMSSKGYRVLRRMSPNNVVTQTLGVFIIWLGWHGLTAGSTFQVTDGAIFRAAKVAVNTTLSGAAAAAIVGAPAGKLLRGYYDVNMVMHCAMAGLVSISASCGSVPPAFAILIGIIGALIYVAASEAIVRFHIDDPVDAFPIHGAAGFWGVLAVGIFSSDPDARFEVQLVGGIVIALWSMTLAFVIFKFCELTVGVRVSTETEGDGIDVHQHGGSAFNTDTIWNLDDVLLNRATRKALMGYMKSKYCEESLEFLLECKTLFDALDMDFRIEFLAEERESVSEVIEVKKHVFDLITHIVETYVYVMSEKEININSVLKQRIVKAFKGEPISVRSSLTLKVPKNKSLSQRVGLSMGVPIDPSTDGVHDFDDYDMKKTPSSSDILKNMSDDDEHPATTVTTVTAITSTTTTEDGRVSSKAKELAAKYAKNSGTISMSMSGIVTTKPTRRISRDFMLSFLDAYKEIHRLVFQNFYFNFSHTEAFTKAREKAEFMSRMQ